MFKGSFQIARVFGVPIRVDVSLLILAGWLWMSSADAARRLGLAHSTAIGFVLGSATAVLLLLSIALHELGHTWAALRLGCRVRDITLMLMGGRATLLDMPRAPWKELVIAIAGPLVSFLLWLGGRLAAPVLAGPVPIAAFAAGWLADMNGVLLVFNLIPAFPMDGGRVLRAALATRLGRLRATFIASRIGRVLAVAMGFYGLYTHQWMLLLVALFVHHAAGAEYRLVQLEETGGWNPFQSLFGGRRPEPPPTDRVRVSPPPYARGRGDNADVFPER